MHRQLWLAAWLGLAPAVANANPSAAAAAPAAQDASGSSGTYAYLTRDGSSSKLAMFADESQSAVVAMIGEEPVTLGELTLALAGAHESMSKDVAPAGKKDFRPILDRLIEVRLIAVEAREMGIDELPEVKSAIESYRYTAGLDMLKARVVAAVPPDRKEADRLYRDAVREWTVKSVLFSGELDAKQAAVKLKAPNAFETVAAQFAAQNKAKFTDAPQPLPRNEIIPQVAFALQKLKKGAVSDPVKVKDGFAVLKVVEVRYPENAAARAQTRATSLGNQQRRFLQKYYQDLIKRYAKVDRALLKKLDFEAAKPGLEALKKDSRVLATFAEGPPILVSDLTTALMEGFYHGVENAVKEKKINRQKEDVFDGMLSKRVIPLQVKADRLQETDEYKRRMADYEMGILFSKFIEKAVIPKIDTSDEALRKFHAEHRGEYMYPTFYKLESLAFTNVKAAEDAIAKLRAGTDFKFLNANADGQSKAEERKLGINGVLAATGLTKEVAATLAGAKKDDFRLHAGDDGQFYAIHVLDVIGAKEQPFEEVREAIGQRVFNEGITNGVKKWAGVIRAARPVQVFLTRIGS